MMVGFGERRRSRRRRSETAVSDATIAEAQPLPADTAAISYRVFPPLRRSANAATQSQMESAQLSSSSHHHDVPSSPEPVTPSTVPSRRQRIATISSSTTPSPPPLSPSPPRQTEERTELPLAVPPPPSSSQPPLVERSSPSSNTPLPTSTTAAAAALAGTAASSPVLWLVVLLVFVLSALLVVRRKRLPVRSGRVLLVTAHPDDECMFFAPTVLNLTKRGCQVSLLCLSTGNADGLGLRRRTELRRAIRHLGIREGDVTVLDYGDLQDGSAWSSERVWSVVEREAHARGVHTLLSFDEHGVSSHHNHVAVFHALQLGYARGLVPVGVQIFVLDSAPLIRKYISWLDLPWSSASAPFAEVSWPLAGFRSMLEHRSQLVWFRWLYLLFSRYLWVNTLRRMPMPPVHYVYHKKKST